MENKENHQENLGLKLSLLDFNFGHYPDTKEPPWGLNETTWTRYSLIAQAVARADELVPGQEKLICNAEADFGNKVIPVKISIWKDPNNLAALYVRASPIS